MASTKVSLNVVLFYLGHLPGLECGGHCCCWELLRACVAREVSTRTCGFLAGRAREVGASTVRTSSVSLFRLKGSLVGPYGDSGSGCKPVVFRSVEKGLVEQALARVALDTILRAADRAMEAPDQKSKAVPDTVKFPTNFYELLAVVDLLDTQSVKNASNPKKTANKKGFDGVAHENITVAPVVIDVPLATRWSAALKAAAEGPKETVCMLDPLVRKVSLSGKNGGRGETWRDRLLHEAGRMDTLLRAVGECAELEGVVISDVCGGRLKVFYPAIGQVDFFKSISGASRHVVTGHRLLELDISGAHPAAAFAAVVAMCDGEVEHARLLTPKLALVVEDRGAAIGILCSQYGAGELSDGDCKVKLLRSLNQSTSDETHCMRKPFLKALVEERKSMTNALLDFAPISCYVDAIRDKAMESNKDTTLLSLLMQAVEQAIIERGIEALEKIGWQFVVPISDAVLLSPTSDSLRTPAACEAARVAMEASARELLGSVGVKVKVDHFPTGGKP